MLSVGQIFHLVTLPSLLGECVFFGILRGQRSLKVHTERGPVACAYDLSEQNACDWTSGTEHTKSTHVYNTRTVSQA